MAFYLKKMRSALIRLIKTESLPSHYKKVSNFQQKNKENFFIYDVEK